MSISFVLPETIMIGTAKGAAEKFFQKYRPSLFEKGVGARLPDEYKKFYDEWRKAKPEPVHYIPKEGLWERKYNKVNRIQNVPLPGRHPKELEQVLTGGEMVIQGFRKKRKWSVRTPHFWMPITYKSVVYSEILDKYISVILTKRVIELIHKYEGFDNYLLQTKACDLKTLVALKLKRKLLFALNSKELPYDEEKNNNIIKKYEQYLPPSNEIEWYGLSFGEACRKLEEIEKLNQEASRVPLKYLYRASLVNSLKTNTLTEEKTEADKSQWLSKVPGVNKFLK